MPIKRLPLEQRFLSKFDKNGPLSPYCPERGNCWPWKHRKNKAGYGEMWGTNRKELAHRIAYKLHYGYLADDIQVQHWCNNPPCVRWNHLYLGDHAINAAYKSECGRGNVPKGEAHYDHKLTEEKVREARRRYIPRKTGRPPKGWPKGTTCRELAKEFGVTQNAMKLALRGVTWKMD